MYTQHTYQCALLNQCTIPTAAGEPDETAFMSRLILLEMVFLCYRRVPPFVLLLII